VVDNIERTPAPVLTRWFAPLARWRRQRRVSPVWSGLVGLILVIIAMPVVAVFVLALGTHAGVWPLLWAGTLSAAVRNTAGLMAATGAVTLTVGVATAWLVTMYRFPGRSIVDRLLVLPLAMPVYIVAYAYGDLLTYGGPVQTALRSLLGAGPGSPALLPEIRSLGGAVFVFSVALYPYVYLSARASFVQQSVCALEVGRTLGRTPLGVFFAIALPMARPALAAGTGLVLMECVADLAAVQYLGVETLTASIFALWLQRSNLGGAAQLAMVLLVLIAVLFAAEHWARGGARNHGSTGRYRSIPFHDLDGVRGIAAAVACFVPFALGFAVPALLLARHALTHLSDAFEAGFFPAARNSVVLAAAAAGVALAVALILAYARRVAPNGLTRPAVRIAGLGYALPGTVLALGLLIPLAAFDNGLDTMMRSWFGVSTGLLLTGSLFALTLALTIRFLAVALGAIDSGLARISPNLDAAARALGETALSTLWRVHLPLLTPALASGALLVFVDAMKELPATLLLRPFNFETLATHVYSLAAIEQFEQASLGALVIVLAGLIPVLALHATLAQGRAGGHQEP
jgi:iron(III) transport system permease protein